MHSFWISNFRNAPWFEYVLPWFSQQAQFKDNSLKVKMFRKVLNQFSRPGSSLYNTARSRKTQRKSEPMTKFRMNQVLSVKRKKKEDQICFSRFQAGGVGPVQPFWGGNEEYSRKLLHNNNTCTVQKRLTYYSTTSHIWYAVSKSLLCSCLKQVESN